MSLTSRAIRFVVAAVVLAAGLRLHAETTARPDPLDWWNDWRRIIKLPYIHPDIANARIALNEKTSSIEIIDNQGKAIGFLSIGMNRATVSQFQTYRTSVSSKDIGIRNARKNADAFVHALTGPLKGVENVTEPTEIDDAGKYVFYYSYLFRDIDYLSVDVDIDHAGYVVGCFIHPSLQELYHIRLEDLKPSLDEAKVLAGVRKALAAKGYKDAIIRLGSREYLEGVYSRSAIIEDPPLPDGSVKVTIFSYSEGSRIVNEVGSYTRWPMIERKRPSYISDTDPAWMPDGTTVCWSTGHLWDACPPWIPNHPDSLAIRDGKSGKVAAFRPLPDAPTTLPNYHNPSPSPDGRYLACTINDEILAVVDCRTNQLTSAEIFREVMPAGIIRIGHAIWSPDSRSLLLVVNGRVCRWTAAGMTSVFANPPEWLPIPGTCRAVKYLPGAGDTLIAVYQEQNAPDEDQWHLARITLTAGQAPAIELLAPVEVFSVLQVTPDGKQVLYILKGQAYLLELATRQSRAIPWLKFGHPVGEGLTVSTNALVLSPDGKTILFTAEILTPEEEGIVICSAALDGTNVRRLSPKGNAVLPRYLLNGRATVDPETLTGYLLEKMRYIMPLDWRDETD